ncbi:MarR family winged helix-turn-helix transcriptional regulator [Streptomyces sp. VMFN-G11Ma]|uniref:MarR family winged helix-turn-helix transcriptional regulator n=1 Tax=Streptomyces sp. VMFN-G11Ma TaxID=2135609 RepID=UPI000D3D456C|nr:MarR family transcriptional regulator [Streptomyces sp. VMFN-G11Ma]PTM86992.1 DNA-binding MarR family transcriptional regulator [Streptomyces sp. VMFN-G11Ma]
MKVNTGAGRGEIRDPSDTAQLAYDLRLAMGRVTRRLRQAHAVGDVSLSGMSVLARLSNDGPDTPTALAEMERVRPQAMASTLTLLEQRGLVGRSPDPADGRRSIVTITDEGRTMLAERRSESVHRLGTVLEGFTADERAALAAALPLLDRMAAQL